jgi:hypothetical protein
LSLGPRYKRWKSPDRKRPEHDIHMRRSFDKTMPLLLGNTSSHTDHKVGLEPFHTGKTTQEAVHLVLSLLTDRTRIHYNQIGTPEL